jgi:hypothetical protein
VHTLGLTLLSGCALTFSLTANLIDLAVQTVQSISLPGLISASILDPFVLALDEDGAARSYVVDAASARLQPNHSFDVRMSFLLPNETELLAGISLCCLPSFAWRFREYTE